MKNSKKFWNWLDVRDEADGPEERVLEINGEIASESWFDDDVTPKLFKDELLSGSGPITIWLNSPGGDCIAASQIYTMLMDYEGEVTIKIDGIAASAASVIAMAGTKVLMAPTALMMIHNPMTMAWGDKSEMTKAIEMLDEVKESIVNAYEIKTGMSRTKLSHLMDAETWMDAHTAVDLGFADEIMARPADAGAENHAAGPMLFSRAAVTNHLMDKLAAKCRIEKKPTKPERSVDDLMERLNLMTH